jgi:DNA polymerase-3 subunit alpha (Gram-positive type)
MEPYIVLDIETTGLSKYYHQITEIAAVKVDSGRVVDEFETLINPGVNIPRYITRLTGIDNTMVKHSPPIQKVLPLFLEFLGTNPIVAHNTGFDMGFLEHQAIRVLDKNLKNDRLCTRRISYRIVPEVTRRRLGDLCRFFEVENQQAHRAMGDVVATHHIFLRLLERLNNIDVHTSSDIISFQKLSKAKVEEITYSRNRQSPSSHRLPLSE